MNEPLGAWCQRWLGSAVSEVVFQAGSLSTVVGVRLLDGREVVVKARRSAGRVVLGVVSLSGSRRPVRVAT